MVVTEIGSRVYRIEHSGNLQTAFGRGDDSMPVKEGRGLYLVRLELPTGVNPELGERRFNFNVKTTKDGITFQKGIGGGRRGWVGEAIPFENFITSAQMPLGRTARYMNNPTITATVRELFGNLPYDCNVNVLSDFEGYRQGFGTYYDELRTHLPLIVEALNELSGKK
jgi:hypothetical protein